LPYCFSGQTVAKAPDCLLQGTSIVFTIGGAERLSIAFETSALLQVKQCASQLEWFKPVLNPIRPQPPRIESL
jgi:hypothetical protein